jgi:N-acetylmuramoyl-L-alanine amidase
VTLLSFSGAPHGGRQRHLPEWQSQPRITPRAIIDHSIVGTGEQGFRHFRDNSALESHFIVENNGEVWQLMDTGRQADANLNGNSYAVSIETGDFGDPDRQPWTRPQLESLIWLHEAIRDAHPTIPRRRSRSCSDPNGLGYHTLHGSPSCWTPVRKSCPGTVRKSQWAQVLLPAFLNPDLGEDMPLSSEDIDKIVNRWQEKYGERLAQWIGGKANSVYQSDRLDGAPAPAWQSVMLELQAIKEKLDEL